MSLSVGDAVLTFLADSSQLDQAFARIPEQSEKAMSAAADSVGQVGGALKGVQFELDATGSNATYAGGMITTSFEKAELEIERIKQKLAETAEAESVVGQVAEQVGSKMAGIFGLFGFGEIFKSLIEGAQHSVIELSLLSEKTGIAIETLSGVEHVAKSAGVQFDQVAGALTRLSRAQALAIEGGKQQEKAFERIGIKVSELKSLSPEELFYRVADAMSNSSSHAAAAASAFALLGRGGAALIPIFQQGGEELRGMVTEAAKASGVTQSAAESAREWEAQTANLSESLRANLIPLMQGLVPIMRVVETSGAQVAMILRDIGAAIGGLGLVVLNETKSMGSAINDLIHGNFKKIGEDSKAAAERTTAALDGIWQQFKDNYRNTTESIKEIWTDTKPLKAFNDDLSGLGKASKDATKGLKADLDQQLADIEAWKASQHAAFETRKIDLATWLAAEVHATDAAAIAHEHYLARVVAVYTKNGEAEKAQAAQQELSALQTKNAAVETDKLATAMDKHRAATKKVVDEYQKLIDAGIDKDFRATEKAAELAAAAELKLAAAQAKVRESAVNAHFSEQEKAIEELAKYHLITEQQKADRLQLLYHQEEEQLLSILKDTLAKEQQAIKDAQSKLSAAQSNPFITPEQIAEMKRLLGAAEQAEAATQAKIETTTKQFHDKELTLDKAHYGQALALATAYGKQILAAQLQENHAALLSAQAQLANARARDLDTAAIRRQIAALKQSEKALENEATAGHNVSGVMVEMKTTTEDTAKTMQSSFATAMAAMISGQESFGAAMESAVFKMLGQLAQHWADYYLALAIGNSWTDPAAAAEEYAAAAALEIIAGAMSGLSGTSSKSASSSTAGTNAGITPSKATATQPNPVQTINTLSLAGGGLASQPTFAIIGDSANGGEAVIPLENTRALNAIAMALVPALVRAMNNQPSGRGGINPSALLSSGTLQAAARVSSFSSTQSAAANSERDAKLLAQALSTAFEGKMGGGQIHIQIESDIPQLVKKINHSVSTGRTRLLASDSMRLTKRT